MDLLPLAVPLLALVVMVALFLGIVWFVLPYAERRTCPRCGNLAKMREACAVCGAAAPVPPAAHPEAQPYGFLPPASPLARAPEVRDGVAYNRGITRRVVTLATAAMGLGIGVRLVGMLGVLGLPAVPALVDGALTVIGGLVAFVGFVFLDAA